MKTVFFKNSNMIVNENKIQNTPTGGALVGKRKGQTMIHNKGSMSGYLVGKTHAEGGIKAINKSTGQPLEMQGGEVVITAPAVSDQTKRNFEGKMMTNREILSAINERGGGVSFADGGELPSEMHFSGTSYNYGGKMLSDHDIAYELSQCGCEHEYNTGGNVPKVSLKILNKVKKLSDRIIEIEKMNLGNDVYSYDGNLSFKERAKLISEQDKLQNELTEVTDELSKEQCYSIDSESFRALNTAGDYGYEQDEYEIGGIFHGSPYSFNKFTTETMGTGSGKQIDGWGIYLTNSKDSSKIYGKNIYETTLFKGKDLSEYTFIDLDKPVKKDIVTKIVKAVYKKYNKDFDVNKFNKYYDYTKDNSLQKLDFNDYELIQFDYFGFLFYKTLSRILGGDKKASLFLLDNGIDGLKRNISKTRIDYVIFDAKDITVEKKENYAIGGKLIKDNLSKDAKSGNHASRDLNNYNDVLDVGADGEVGADIGLYDDGGLMATGGNLGTSYNFFSKVSSSRLLIPNVRGGWTKEKIIKYFKDHSSDRHATFTLTKYISEFDNWEQFKDHIYYHGTQSYIEKGLKPSITMSDRTIENIGGGGYGQKYFGISLTKRKKTAESFSGMSSGVSIYPIILKRDANVIEREDLQDASEVEDIIVELYEKGIDAVWIGGGEEELVVVNPYSIILYKKGVEYHSVYGGFKSVALTDEKIKEIYDNAVVLATQYSNEYKSKTNKEDREQFLSSIPSIQFVDGGLIAPNGKTSNLTPEQYKLVRTPEFKAWFGDWENDSENASKVVDENGEPLVVWRGESKDFNKFDYKKLGSKLKTAWRKAGFYFSPTKNGAEQYMFFMQSGILKQFFLNIKNPYTLDSKEFYGVMDWGSLPNQRFKTNKSATDYANLQVEIIKNQNHDGFFVTILEDENVVEIVAFEPTQIKIANGTNTTFDSNNPDIRYNDGGGIDKANYRILKSNGRIKNAGTGMPSWFTLDKAKQNVDYSQGEMIYEYDNDGERLWEVFVDGGAVGSDFTFLKSNPMQRARAITVLEKKIRHDGKIISNYEFLEQLPKNLEVGVSKLFSRKTERGYVEKLTIGDFIVDSKAEVEYYQYLQNGGYPYSKYIKEVTEAEAKKNEADKIIRDEQQKANELKNIENQKNSEIYKKNQIKELIEKGADAMIKKMNAPRLIQIEKYKTQRQTNDVKEEINFQTRMIEQTERQIKDAYKIASNLYEIVNGEVQPKFNWKVGDKVKVEGYLNRAPAEIETEIVEANEGKYGEIIYQVEKKEGIANNYISYDGLYPLTQNNEKQNKKEYEYVLTIRPFDIGTYPKDNFIRFEQQKYQYGVVIYSEPLPIREIEHFSLCPITEIKEFNNKFLYYTFSDTKQKIQVKLIPDERKGYFVEIIYYDGDKVEDNVMMSAVQFLKNVQEGNYKLENEIKDEPKKDDVEITTGYFKVDSQNTGFEYAKKINNYFNKWNKIKTLQDKLDFETLDVPMFGSFENETVLDQIERFEKLGFELFANEIVRNDFKKEVRKIIDKKISDREMEKRRYPKEDEEVGKKEKSFESEGSTKGKGKLYEFFTPQVVADKMLALAQHYGFKGGNVLEPATGSGRLIKNLKNTNITAFEISKDNFEILKREFPNAELYNFNFEKAFLKEPRFNTLLNRKGTETWLKGAPFDLVMANPPYGEFYSFYSSYFNFKGQVEHFFILQTLYLLKKGGLGVYLIPSSFLRNGVTYNEIKKQIFEIAEFVDAYRLPSNIFEKTQIGTDILILRKK